MPTSLADREWAELDQVRAWRAEELERAGYAGTTAFTLALCPYVDLHEAIELLERGCPPDVAFNILT